MLRATETGVSEQEILLVTWKVKGSNPGRPAHSQRLYWLSYPAHSYMEGVKETRVEMCIPYDSLLARFFCY